MLVLDTVHEELVGVISRGVVPNVILLSLDLSYQLGIVAREIGKHDMASKVAASLATLPELPNLEVDPLVEARDIVVELGKLGIGPRQLGADQVWVHCSLHRRVAKDHLE